MTWQWVVIICSWTWAIPCLSLTSGYREKWMKESKHDR